ncbi:MAG: MarC family protein [bacterium]|nr:MarC family protein [bacterium]
MDITAFILLAFSSLFAVIDPLGAIPFFSGLTAHMDQAKKRKTLFRALAVAFGVLVVFILAGHQLLEVFGITLDAFRIAGGIIFFGIGLDMLQSKPRRWQTGIKRAYAADQVNLEEEEIDDPSITPLGIPLMAGPGSITSVMILTPQAPTDFGPGLLIIAVLGILLLTGGILMAADVVLKRLGRTGLKIIEKLMGLLVTVIAVQLVLDGLTPVIKKLAS